MVLVALHAKSAGPGEPGRSFGALAFFAELERLVPGYSASITSKAEAIARGWLYGSPMWTPVSCIVPT